MAEVKKASKTKVQQQTKANFIIAASGKLLWIVFAVYILALVFGVVNHEPWRDEAQSWLVARDNDLTGLFKLLPSEGHPPLWYLILMPFAKAGFPYATLNWLSAIIMIASVYLLLFKTKLPVLLKLLLPFSYIFFYEYSVLSRNYCLVIFFIAAIISIYPRRFDKPLIFALCLIGLFNSHMLAFGLSFGLLAIYIVDAIQLKRFNKKVKLSILLMCICGLYLIPYIAMNKSAGMFEAMITDHAKKIADAITGAILVDGNNVIAYLFLTAFAIILSVCTKPFFIFLAGATGVLYILGYKYNLGDARHFGVLFAVIIAAFGTCDEYKDDRYNFIKITRRDTIKYGSWLFALIIVLQFWQTFGRYKEDIEKEFSDAKNAAEYITDHNLQNAILVGHQAWAVSAIVPYLPKDVKVYYAECSRYGTYYIYDSCFLQNKWDSPPENAIDVAYQNFKDRLGSVVFIFNSPLSERSMQYMEMLYHSNELPIKKDEAFYIYRFRQVVKQ